MHDMLFNVVLLLLLWIILVLSDSNECDLVL